MGKINFKDQKIWITGASSGIGLAMAHSLAKVGAYLVISGRRQELLRSLKEDLIGLGSPGVDVVAFDLEHSAEVEAAVQEVRQLWGAPDILILSGGLSQRSLVIETELKVYRRLMEVDYMANVALSKAFLPQWQKDNRGHIVIISSLVGKIPTPYRSGYAAAKHALHGYFESLRAEHAHLKINIICPGFIHTQVSVNALTGDNSALGQMDRAQAEGMKAEVFTRKALRVIKANRALSLIGGKKVWGVHLYTFMPSIL